MKKYIGKIGVSLIALAFLLLYGYLVYDVYRSGQVGVAVSIVFVLLLTVGCFLAFMSW